MDYSILVGGEAGQGMDTFARLLEKNIEAIWISCFFLIAIICLG